MKTIMVGDLVNNLDEVMDMVKHGEAITISSDKKKKKYIAVLIPFAKYTGSHKRKLGILEKKASFSMRDDFKITDEELFAS